MAEPPTNSLETRRIEIVQRFFALLGEKNISEWTTLLTDDAAILVFYPPAGFSNRIEGKAAIGDAFNGLFANFASFGSTISAIYSAPGSEAVIVEYSNRATLVGGAEYANDNIAVFRFRGEKIFAYHDYFDPRRFAIVVEALGGQAEEGAPDKR